MKNPTSEAFAGDFERELRDPPREFSVLPFWFWNDTLHRNELLRQLEDFERHGVHGFVIHPRVGLPRHQGWMSDELLGHMQAVLDEAARRNMKVVLYDEGMYPSGSACGQVVAKDPNHVARALFKVDHVHDKMPDFPVGWKVVARLTRPDGTPFMVVDRPSGGTIRGLHFLKEEGTSPPEDEPAAADILNPEAVASFINLVHGNFARHFRDHFGKTIMGIFTDEPAEMGRVSTPGLVPGSLPVLARVREILGYDFTPHLGDLWHDDHPESLARRRDYHRAIHQILGETYYAPLGAWCEQNSLALMGHPGASNDLGFERYFHVPGQDLVWRYVEPGPKALSGVHATMAKCAASAMVHLGHRRNGNELYGAYGHDLTFDEMKWLAHWCFIRGQNLLYPHAFYYSIRGPRYHERPPDVGPNAPWWPDFKPFADACRRLSWINSDCTPVCDIAILALPDELPERVARILFQNQRDFHYLETRHLWEDARVDGEGIHLAGMTYGVVVLDGLSSIPSGAIPALEQLAKSGRVLSFEKNQGGIPGVLAVDTPDALMISLSNFSPPRVFFDPPTPSIRLRMVQKGGRQIILLFQEEMAPVETRIHLVGDPNVTAVDPVSGERISIDLSRPLSFAPGELKVLLI